MVEQSAALKQISIYIHPNSDIMTLNITEVQYTLPTAIFIFATVPFLKHMLKAAVEQYVPDYQIV